MTVMPVGAVGISPFASTLPPTSPVDTTFTGTDLTSGTNFGELVSQGLKQLEALQSRADDLAVLAATGKLTDVHDYTIAATEAAMATQLTVALRNKALEAFNEIMRMPA